MQVGCVTAVARVSIALELADWFPCLVHAPMTRANVLKDQAGLD
jgi:uncharacterized membrane protein YqaE (UPF0057 family)